MENIILVALMLVITSYVGLRLFQGYGMAYLYRMIKPKDVKILNKIQIILRFVGMVLITGLLIMFLF